MINDYNDFEAELDKHFNTIIETITPIDQELTQRLITTPDDELIIMSHDILRRVVSNIRVLRGIKINDETCVAYRLILRAVTADLIECFYLIAVSEDIRKQEIWNRNLEAVRTLKIVARDKKEFFETLIPNSVSDIDIARLHKTNTSVIF